MNRIISPVTVAFVIDKNFRSRDLPVCLIEKVGRAVRVFRTDRSQNRTGYLERKIDQIKIADGFIHLFRKLRMIRDKFIEFPVSAVGSFNPAFQITATRNIT